MTMINGDSVTTVQFPNKKILQKSNINYGQCRALTSLKEDTSIVMLPADKGRASVVLNNETYHDKMANMITSGSYRTISKDHTDHPPQIIASVL